ncbi:MAG: hypothetical protein ACKN9R_05460 [Candidatus Limnocylindrus sp.]
MTRLLRPPRTIRVAVDGPVPIAIEIDGRMEPVEVIERWRVSDPWGETPIDRDYAKVAGATWILVVYRERSSNSWFLERILD